MIHTSVRNRAKELAELLSDVERIRAERRKAKANRNKYVGTGNDGMSFSGGSGGRYGGFGSDSLSSGSRSYGGGYDRGTSSSINQIRYLIPKWIENTSFRQLWRLHWVFQQQLPRLL